MLRHNYQSNNIYTNLHRQPTKKKTLKLFKLKKKTRVGLND